MEDMKNAMRSGNKADLEVIRFVIAKIKNVEIDKGELNDDGIQKLIAKQIKESTEVIADYEKAGRQDLSDKNKADIEVLKKYLPAPLSESEVDALIDKIISENPGANMGMIIGKVNQQSSGRADGAMIAKKVRDKLSA